MFLESVLEYLRQKSLSSSALAISELNYVRGTMWLVIENQQKLTVIKLELSNRTWS